MSRRARKPAPVKQIILCAIYTRKSSEEGLDQEFNSLDAQRESAEAFIASQKAEGWTVVPERYDDGGYSGGNIERPALERLLRDIDKDKVDCVVVYKVDRLSRSLMDFARIMETFDRHNISFVSVTQQFNTTHSMGRLTLNILLSFAQFEREIIGERIRDKLAAQARKGKWTGGAPVLGYDVDRSAPSPRLVINTREAKRVREIYRMYLQEASLLPVVKELKRRDWPNKSRVTKKGRKLGGRTFDKATLYMLLTNPMYIGMMKYKDEYHNGEHEPIIDKELFDKVQKQLKYNGRTGGIEVRNKYGALLRGLLRCKCCDAAMAHTFNGKNSRNFYRYYRCTHAIKSGHDECPVGTVPAAEIERLVIDEIRSLTQDEALLAQVLNDAQSSVKAELDSVRKERTEQRKERTRHHNELQELVINGMTTPDVTRRIAELNELLASDDQRLTQLDTKIGELECQTITKEQAKAVFSDFDTLWENLIPREQARLLKLLISKVEFDGKAGTVSVTFRPTSIHSLISRKLEDAA